MYRYLIVNNFLHTHQPCNGKSDTRVDCKTPKLHLPPKEDFGNFTANFTIGFIFDDYDEYKELDEERHNISLRMTFVELSSIEMHTWPKYDSSKGEALTLEVPHHPTLCPY
jgi:hypothetical protein